MKYRPTHLIEYAIIRVTGAFLCLLPYRAALAIGWCLAKGGALCLPAKLRMAEDRIRQVLGPEVTDSEVRNIAWRAWRNLIFSAIEVLRSPRHNLAFVQKVTSHQDIKKLRTYLDAGQNAILAIPHMGSWELAGVSASLMGIPLLFIVREQKNPLTNAYLNRMRTGQGQQCIDRDDPSLIRSVLRKIKSGSVLAILPDIRARTDALHVRFLNEDTSVAAGMALFARQLKLPIIPACIVREGWARHRWIAFDAVTPDLSAWKTDDWQRMTQEVLDIFSQVVREYPDQYFWFNKKWILDK